ncbi:SDR family NAD(P)-dependent oxidoreductase [Streptomyces boluensis]|uniref:SDR family NAD(P)-dependent oxidoreductase n=1 Tax=Streptomyces boluensis TaxID=1775135 RepID=A0A964XIF4_9ACTN|nr:SDR family oxidoreductase [Streptomyces boluensis]NBE49990.1 SDR family NAD(P)-dependent oxidoreductase [Streptomyces boluensis]
MSGTDVSSGGSVAVVTGAGRGIGRSIARGLAARGHRVLITDIDEAAARSAAADLGRGCEGIRHDVRDPEGHRAVAERAAGLGSVRVWVNNAGVLVAGDAWRHEADEFRSAVDVNVLGVMAGSRAAVEAMRDGGGSILNVASMAAFGPVPGLAVYAATKAAVLAFTTALQGDLDHAGLPVRAHVLCPDVVDTEMVSARATDQGAAILFANRRQLSADEVARAGLGLLGTRRVVGAVPWAGGLVSRFTGLLPRAGIRMALAARRAGERKQDAPVGGKR